jgi:hypothetical protein
MAGVVVLPDGRRRVDAIREDYAAGLKRGDIARKYDCQFQIVYAATRDMDNGTGLARKSSAPADPNAAAFPQPNVRVNPRKPPVRPPMTLTPHGAFHEPEYIEEMHPVAEDLFPPS